MRNSIGNHDQCEKCERLRAVKNIYEANTKIKDSTKYPKKEYST